MGPGSLAPRANVSFTTFVYVSPVQTIPWCDQTGVPHPLPLLGHLGVGFQDQRPHAGQGLPAPSPQVADPLVDEPGSGFPGRSLTAVAVRLRDARVAAREDDGDLLAFSHLDRLGLTRTWLGLRACLRRSLGLRACVRGLLGLGRGLARPLARDARLAFGFAMLSVIIRPFLLDDVLRVGGMRGPRGRSSMHSDNLTQVFPVGLRLQGEREKVKSAKATEGPSLGVTFARSIGLVRAMVPSVATGRMERPGGEQGRRARDGGGAGIGRAQTQNPRPVLRLGVLCGGKMLVSARELTAEG